jgi:glucose/mannose transport system substrate-binding protein
MRKKTGLVILSWLVLVMVFSACQPTPTPQPPIALPTVQISSTPTLAAEQKQLEIFHWWTAPGEREAAEAMFRVFRSQYPDVEVVQNQVRGGGGTNLRTVLQARLELGNPPDTFQTLGGAELKNYVDGGHLQPLDDLWAELKYAEVIPAPLASTMTVNGHRYAVPLDMHIQNILYYNIPVFNELGINPPETYAELLTVCRTLAEKHPEMSCLALGSKDTWATAFIFDSLLLQAGGPGHYVRFYKGELDVMTDGVYRQALQNFAALRPFIHPEHGSYTWDQSVGLVGTRQSVMVIMGTWAIGAFTKGSNWQPGIHFGAVIFPGRSDAAILFHPDSFGMTVNAPNPQSARQWLRAVASPELQVATDVTQGGLFARTDIDPQVFPDPIRREFQQYVNNNPNRLVLDQHGGILPTAAQAVYWKILTDYLNGDLDLDATLAAVDQMMKEYDVKNASAWYQWP